MSGLKTIGKNPLFTIRYNPRNVPPPVALRYLSKPLNPIHPKIAHMYETRDPTTLWWSIAQADVLDEKRVVRSWCSRRVRTAFRESLKKRGLDENGKKIVLDSLAGAEGEEDMGPTVEDQKGTLVLSLLPGIKKEAFKQIQQMTDEAVDLLIQQSTKMRQPVVKKRSL
jgi:hypothetical protein